ncbi:succinyl-diaminopimelate desuccinylase [Arenicella xantha]|nr:succinyl-diaminopimelate desuccinylase [Arenicella xantha]
MKTTDTDRPTLALTKQLIAAQSVTPNDAGCQMLMTERLSELGFHIEAMNFSDKHGTVQNFWARRGNAKPCLAFAGHTDVVPTGDLKQWESDPFTPTERDGMLYGRGTADMKTSLAAFVTSIERFVSEHPDHKGSIALLITSDEEGPSTCGTVKVIQELEARSEKIDYCLVGEPSSTNQLGDVIKNGRRGSLGCVLTILGTQGHVAYPHLADNPIHRCGAVIEALTNIEWDQGNEYFPPTSFQISNINGGTGATNVIPATTTLTFNLRYSTEIDEAGIKQKVRDVLDQLDMQYEEDWTLFGLPFLTEKGALVNACRQAISDECNIESELSTSGGTSDGRFIAPTGAQVVELGPVNATIHKVNECVDINAPDQLSRIYEGVLRNLLL